MSEVEDRALGDAHPEPLAEGIEVRRARKEDAPALAEIMLEAIRWGRFQELGLPFTTLVHEHIVRTEHAICFSAHRGEETMGYVACTLDNGAFYRQFVVRYGLKAAWVVWRRLLHPKRLAVALRGLTYFGGGPKHDDPKAELISFAIKPRFARLGLGRALLGAACDEFRALGVNRYMVASVEATNEAGNRFYQDMGLELVRTQRFYSDSYSNVYYHTLGGDE